MNSHRRSTYQSWSIRFGFIFSLLVPAAIAQTGVECTAFVANQPILRQEGAAEPAGDILITCNGTLLGAQTGPQTLSLYINGAAITSRQLFTGAAPSSAPTDAALLVNDCIACGPTQGFLQNGALVFSGFKLPNTPGVAFQIRITNLRVNASQLAAGSFVTGTVLATFGIQNQQNLVLGAVQSTLSATVSTPLATLQQCGQQTVTAATLTIKELLNTAFKSPASAAQNSVPGQWYQNGVNTESQTVFTTPAAWTNQLSGVTPGLADAATRIRVSIVNVPPGVTVSLPTNVGSGNSTLVATSGGDIGPFTADSGDTVTLNSTGSVTYEVRTQNGGAIDSFSIPLSIVVSGASGAGQLLVAVTYAPTTVEASNVQPRFQDSSVLVPFFNLLSCLPATHLSFSTQPANGIAGSAIGAVSVQALDVFGNLTATNPAVTLTSTPGAINTTANGTSGVATFSGLIFGNPGTYTLTASAPSLASVTSNPFVIRGPASVTLSSSSGSPRYGQPVTLTATVVPVLATGTVMFYDGTSVLGAGAVSNGQAQLTTTQLLPGLRNLKARYSGNATYSSNLSATTQITVNAIGSNSLVPGGSSSFGNGPDVVGAADLNGDGINDLVVANNAGASIDVLLGRGDGTFQNPIHTAVGNQPVSIAIGDLNGDGKPDLAVANSLDGTVSVLMGRGDGTFTAALGVAVGSNPFSVAITDFNNDGAADLIVANYVASGNNVSVILGNGNGTFQPASSYATGVATVAVAVGDFNRDGFPDIVLANVNSSTASVLINNGDGTLQPPVNYDAGSGPDCLAVADFNGDGIADIAVGNLYSNDVTMLLGLGDGTFHRVSSFASMAAGTGPYAMVAGDFNGDGKLDLAVADISGGGISILMGNGNGIFQTPQTYFTGSSPESIAIADFNGDGRMDLAIANFGSNLVSTLIGSANAPVAIIGQVTFFGTALPGVTISLSGSQSSTTTTDSSGTYAFYGLSPSGSYTVVPSLATYAFGPSTQSIATPSGIVIANFVASAVAANNVTVSGKVTVSGTPVNGATISVNGTSNFSTVTDTSGDYILSLAKNGTYSISASKSGILMSAPVSLVNVTANQTINFSGITQSGLQFYPVTPCRVADTRAAAGFTGQFGPPSMTAGSTRVFNIPASACGIPANAAAFSLNFTVVPPGPLGNLTTWPTGQSMPNVSTLNDPTGTVVANAAIVPAGTNGNISVFVTHATDVLFDINGYFAPPNGSGLQFYPVSPCRIADTRTAAGFTGQFGPPSLIANTARSFNIPQSACNIPSTAQAYSLNFTVVPKTTLGLLTTWPAGRSMPNASTLNSYTGTVVANAAVVPAGTNGGISLFASETTDVLFDINGYFAPAATSGLNFYPMTPCRIADTRVAAGFPAPFGPGSLAANVERSFPVALSSCEVPAGVGAYSLNFTVIPPAPVGFLTSWPTGSGRPNVSTLNSYNGSIVANAAIVPAGNNGSISLFVNSTTDALFDINGYFAQ